MGLTFSNVYAGTAQLELTRKQTLFLNFRGFFIFEGLILGILDFLTSAIVSEVFLLVSTATALLLSTFIFTGKKIRGEGLTFLRPLTLCLKADLFVILCWV